MEVVPFADRRTAGRRLAARLAGDAAVALRAGEDVVVLGLPRGGVPVAVEVATALRAPLDVLVVRKLGVPGHPELAMGAIASGGVRVLNEAVLSAVPEGATRIAEATRAETVELERRERVYRDGRSPVPVAGRTAVVVDDGLATGATMRAAVASLRQRCVGRVVVAVPVGAPEVCADVAGRVDAVVCLVAPEPLGGVGAWYEDFAQTTDDEVCGLLRPGRA